MDKKLELINSFKVIKSKGWIPTHRHGDQALGNAFEDLLNVSENNSEEADFHGIEFKSQRTTSSALMTLFSKAPTYPRGVNTSLRETYGVVEDTHGKRILNTTFTGDRENTHRGGYNYKARVDREKRIIHLEIRNQETGILEDFEVWWSFSVLEDALRKKLKTIAILHGDEKVEAGQRYVRYTKMDILTGLTLEKMITSLEDGELFIDIRIGVYSSGKHIGKTHDHGTAFRIKLDKLLTYGDVESYE
jgi:hypothetical protein